jgi:hypothetical protein
MGVKLVATINDYKKNKMSTDRESACCSAAVMILICKYLVRLFKFSKCDFIPATQAGPVRFGKLTIGARVAFQSSLPFTPFAISVSEVDSWDSGCNIPIPQHCISHS